MADKRKPSAFFTTEGFTDNPSEEYLQDQENLDKWKLVQDIMTNPEKQELYRSLSSEMTGQNKPSTENQTPSLIKDYLQKKSPINKSMPPESNPAEPVEDDSKTTSYPEGSRVWSDEDSLAFLQKFKKEQAGSENDKRTPKLQDPSPWVQFGASFGDALAGRGPAQTAQYFDSLRDRNVKLNAQAELSNPESVKSRAFRRAVETVAPRLAEAMGGSWNFVSAADQDLIFKPIELKQKLDMQNAQLLNAQTVAKINQDGQNQRTNKQIEYKENHPSVGRSEPKQKTLSDAQVNTLNDLDNAETQINEMLKSMKGEYVGPADGRNPDLFIGDDEAAFRSTVGKFEDAYRKAITGAGASEKELQTLKSRLPTITDKGENFISKAKEALKEIQLKRENFKRGLEIQNKDTSKIQSAPQSSNNDEAASIARQKRIAELRAKAGK